MSIDWAKIILKIEKLLHQGNKLFPVHKLKQISKIKDIPNTSRGSQGMSTSEASVQETVFSLSQTILN